MSLIISLILIVISLAVILMIVIKKFPALAILDADKVPGAKEARFKDQIIRQRVERDLARSAAIFARFWLAVNNYLKNFFSASQAKLKKVKLNYRLSAALSYPEKQKRARELFLAADDRIKKNDLAGAEEKLIEIIALDQKSLRAFFSLAGVYETQKKWPEAKQTYEYALKLARQYKDDETIMGDLTPAEIYFSLAETGRAADDLDAALENIQEALELDPNNPRFLDLILDLSIMKKDYALAKEYWEKLAQANPENNKLAEWQEKIEALEKTK